MLSCWGMLKFCVSKAKLKCWASYDTLYNVSQGAICGFPTMVGTNNRVVGMVSLR